MDFIIYNPNSNSYVAAKHVRYVSYSFTSLHQISAFDILLIKSNDYLLITPKRRQLKAKRGTEHENEFDDTRRNQNLGLSQHESHNRNKNLVGYHVYLVWFIADLRHLSYIEKEKIVTNEKLHGTTAELLVTSLIRTRAPSNPFLAVPSQGKEDVESLPGDPLFAIPNSLCAGSGRGPLWIPMSKFTASNFDIKEEEERATDASVKWRAGEYFKLAGIYWRRLPEEGREAWKARARYINTLVPVGVFKVVPVEFGKNFVTAALASLTADCDVLRRSVVTALRRRRPPREVSQSSVSFLSVSVNVQSQYLLRAPISLLLQNIISEVNFEKFTPNIRFCNRSEMRERNKY